MKITILAQHYAPEEVSGAILATELCEELIYRGHNVTFITCAPNYPEGKIFPGYKNWFTQSEILNKVKVIRVWSFITQSKATLPRIIQQISFSCMAFWGIFKCKKSDVIFCYSPPLPLGISAWLMSIIWGVPWILRIEDLYPDAAIATGIVRNKKLINLLSLLEKFLYRKTDHISVISDGFRKNLLAKKVPSQKISVEKVWADPEKVNQASKENKFRKYNHLEGKFVVLYSGNMGTTSNLDDVINAAKILNENIDIYFLFVGEGIKKNDLIKTARYLNLNQVIFLPYQPKSDYPELLAASDLGLVTINQNSSPYSLPSKIFNHMASERPIISISPKNSEIETIIEIARCGINITPGNPKEIVEKIIYLKNNPNQSHYYGQNGRKYLELHHSRALVISQYEKMLQSLVI